MEYKNIKYVETYTGKWLLTYPSGIKGVCLAENEEELKKMIDKLGHEIEG